LKLLLERLLCGILSLVLKSAAWDKEELRLNISSGSGSLASILNVVVIDRPHIRLSVTAGLCEEDVPPSTLDEDNFHDYEEVASFPRKILINGFLINKKSYNTFKFLKLP
jgi:hypothetical protein